MKLVKIIGTDLFLVYDWDNCPIYRGFLIMTRELLEEKLCAVLPGEVDAAVARMAEHDHQVACFGVNKTCMVTGPAAAFDFQPREAA